MATIFLPGNDQYTIPAIYTKAISSSDSGGGDLVILCHGISTNKDEYLDFLVTMANGLNEKGISTLRFDFRGHGESSLASNHFSISSQLLDLYHVIRWSMANIQPKRLSFFGVSFGAPPCLMIDRWIEGVELGPRFLVAPVLDYTRTFLEPESTWGKETFHESAIHDALKGKPIELSEDFYAHGDLFMEMSTIDIEHFVSRCTSSVHIMHGENDDMVPCEISESIAQRNPNVAFSKFPNMEHGFTDKGDESGQSSQTQENIRRMIQIIFEGLRHVR